MSIPDRIPVPTPLGHGRYRVESDTRPGQFYDVDATIPGSCSCPGFSFHGACKHLDRLQGIEKRQADTVLSLQEQLAQMRRERAKAIDLSQCCTCHSRPAAAGYAECGFCRMDAVFGVKAVAS